MKKLFAIVLAVAMVLTLSVSAFAAVSPGAKIYHKVTVINGIGSTPVIHTVEDGKSVEVVVDPSKGDFDDWKIYKEDGTVAKEGVDYTIVGKLTDEKIVVTPKTDLIITGNYNGKGTDPLTGGESKPQAPQTGDFSMVYLTVIALAALGFAGVAKKQLSK